MSTRVYKGYILTYAKKKKKDSKQKGCFKKHGIKRNSLVVFESLRIIKMKRAIGMCINTSF